MAFDEETVWLTKKQMVDLFGRDRTVISRHISNIFEESEFEQKSNVHFMHVPNSDKPAEAYSLDVIISVGYRVKSKRGVEFRKWANSVLKDYIIKGYAVNNNRINQLGEMVRIMKRSQNQLDAKQVLSIIERYALALDMLDDYDHQRIEKPKGNQSSIYILDYEECMNVISTMIFGSESALFGAEKDESFKSSIVSVFS